MKLLLIFLVNLLLAIVYTEKYHCSQNHTIIYLQTDEIAFYYSDLFDFANEFKCNITFVLNSTHDVENVRCYGTIRHLESSINLSPVYYYFSHNLSFLPIYAVKEPWYTQYLEGSVIFEDWGNSYCPLESISRINPYEFIDENQVLYLTNILDGTNTSIHPCKWQFTSPNEYGFKIVIEVFEFDGNTKFIIENRTDILVNEKSVKLNHPLYNPDTYIQINLMNHSPNLRFQAYISIVKSTFVKEDGNCSFYQNVDPPAWIKYRYGNNQECTMNISVSPNTEVMISGQSFFVLGDVGDYVGYFDEENIFVKFEPLTDDYIKYNFMLLPYKNESTPRIVTWKFISDGSIPGLGFTIEFTHIQCQCESVIKCGVTTHVMNTASITYCSNLECTLNIQPCLAKFTRLNIGVDAPEGTSYPDLFQIYSNDSHIRDFYYSNVQTSKYFFLLNSDNENILKAFTFHSTKMRHLSFKTLPFDVPPISAHVILSPDNPSYIIDSQFHHLILIEISKEMEPYDYAFEIHRMYDGSILLYDNENLTNQLNENCPFESNTNYKVIYTCKILNYKTFVVLDSSTHLPYQNSFYPYAAIQLLNVKKKCIFDKSIFQQLAGPNNNIPEDRIIAAISNPFESCMITFLIPLSAVSSVMEFQTIFPYIPKVWTTSKNETVKVFAGNYRNQSLFEYNSATQNYWKNILLESPVYAFEIPKNSSIFIAVSSIQFNSFNSLGHNIRAINVTISEFPYYSVASTPCFGLSKGVCQENLHQRFDIGKYAVKFTAKYLSLPEYTSVSLLVNSTEYRFLHTGEYHIFRNQVVLFGYSNFTIGDVNSGAIITIESLNVTIG